MPLDHHRQLRHLVLSPVMEPALVGRGWGRREGVGSATGYACRRVRVLAFVLHWSSTDSESRSSASVSELTLTSS